jgi:hypothetical protein
MDRAALTVFLATEYDSLLAGAGIAPTDTPDGLTPVLDNVAAIVDAYPDLVSRWHRELARYYALDRIVNRLGTKVDISTGGDSYKLNQKFTNPKALRDEAKRTVAWLVDPAPTVTGAEMGGRDIELYMPFLTEEVSW